MDMNITKFLGLKQSVDVLEEQLADAKLAPPESGTYFKLVCGERLFFEDTKLGQEKIQWMLEKYENFAYDLATKIEDQAVTQVPNVYVHPRTAEILKKHVGEACRRILANEDPYKAVFVRKNYVLVNIFLGILLEGDKQPKLMLDIRTEEWMKILRKGKEEFVPNGPLERITDGKRKS